jgi:nickel-type superoxide dismutase maturation protease
MLRLLKLSGDSLSPEYQIGDFVFVSKIPYFFTTPAVGDVVAFHQPGYGMLVKRIQQLTSAGSYFVTGSHPDSIDSRVYGPVNRKALVGKVIWHIRKT